MGKEKYEAPNIVVLNGSGNELDPQPFGLILVPIFVVTAIALVVVAAAGVFAVEGAVQVQAAVSVDVVVSTTSA